jgi:hypothetical protein
MLLVQSQAYREYYGMNAIHLLVTSMSPTSVSILTDDGWPRFPISSVRAAAVDPRDNRTSV